MKNYIRILTMIFALTFGAVSGAWAQLTNDDIEIDKKPSDAAGTIAKSINARVVTLTVTPATGYFIRVSDFVIEKLVSPGQANAPKRRVAEITDTIKGKMYNSGMTKEITSVEAGSTAKYVFTLPAGYDGAYVTSTFHLLTEDNIIRITANTDLGNTPDMTKHYVLVEDVSATVVDKLYSNTAFTGIFDGGSYTISGLTHPLFKTVNGGVVKNLMLKNVHISQSGHVGAICGTASGYSRIYNCGILPSDNTFSNRVRHSSVASTDNNRHCGSLVGLLNDDSRVVNCFSYANVNGGDQVAGIVGYNNYNASTAEVSDGKYTKLKTAVVNCMFYGNITGGNKRYPVYGGRLITNAASTGINNYNYYSSNSTFNTASGNPDAYNCSFPAEVRYLTQVEFHRSLLNSNRELCGWWVGSDVAPSTLTTAEVQAIPKDASLMYKWVVDPSVAPYPILKPFGKYASVVNSNTGKPWVDRATANPYEGKQLGTLTVTVKSGSHASIASRVLSIPITDMDTLHYDYGYRKIQLPYYNTVFGNPEADTWEEKYANNYTEQVVTGWKITGVTTDGSVATYNNFVADWQDGYNFADRKCTAKDIYSDSNKRVFAQGGYYYVPDGVTGITIEAYWGKAIYVRNNGGYYDRVNITLATTGSAFEPAGTRGNNINGATILSPTKLSEALTAENIDEKKTVYDYALVLVGNVQESVGQNDFKHATEDTRGFTIMSVDLDFDEEPDYCLEWQLGQKMARQIIAPIRFDFLPVVELGIAGKRSGSKHFFSLGCYRSKGHFEVTETAFIRFGQFEFELGTRDDGPVILNGGIYDQYCRGRNGETNQHINYVILGGHIVMPSFTPGAHVNNSAKYKTRHCAVNALGGNFTSFYLTGGYNEGIVPFEDNPHCYIDGGRFGTIAAAYKEGIWGNVTWRINHALIDEFYGGGVMSQATGTTYKIVKGNIDVVIDNSIVGKYCGGPKFGNMVDGKTVTTSATGTTFNQYFGAGNGGTNYVQYVSTDVTGAPITDWSTTINNNYTPKNYRSKDLGYDANYDLEIINTSTGDEDNKVVNRSYYYSAQFATTNTGDVTSTLKDCTIKTNFYGGGFLGGVTGNVTSTLNNCTVTGSVFGAGYSADAGTVNIHNVDKVAPVVNIFTGIIKPQTGGTYTTYYWTHDAGTTGSPITTDGGKNYFYTEIPLDNLGTVSKNVTLNIEGTTTVGESVYGGGEQSSVGGNTKIMLLGGTINGDVYGGGKGRMEEGTSGQEGYISPVAATVGATTVNLNGMTASDYNEDEYGTLGLVHDSETGPYTVDDSKKGCIVKGSIFGCNNLNGTPKGTATVHIYKTQNADATRITNPAEGEKTAKVKGRYDVLAVYGGGNLAAYEPDATVTTGTAAAKEASKPAATVIIDGCERTSIQTVYGGGNAACTPATSVTVNGTYEIDELFGGGNGKDDVVINNETKPNPGANVGYKNYSEYYKDGDVWKVRDKDDADTKEKRLASAYVYGSGQASVNIFGGTIHSVFGGSNTKGNVRKTAVTMLDDNSGCDFCVDEAYGGGKSASMDAEAQLLMACIPGLKAVYGGAEAADLHDNVTLNITNGTFERVFGGNNISGTIRGAITINIEETGCKPVIIGELYGGGNQAGYSVYGYDSDNNPIESGDTPLYNDPQVNVKSFTSIGNIYGGGFGSGATMVGNPTVNVNEVVGTPTNYPSTGDFDNTGYKGKTITLDEGEETEHTVQLPSHTKGKIGSINNIFGGGNAARVIGNTNVNIGTRATIDYVTKGSGEESPRTAIPVVGADVRGNVYGGGNNAEVTGNTNVNIGNRKE